MPEPTPWHLAIERRAVKAIAGLHPRERARVVSLINGLALDPRPHGAIQLKGSSSWRARAGDLRVVYEIYDDVLIVRVVDVGHRSEIYRR